MYGNIPMIMLEDTATDFYEISLTKSDTIVGVVVESFTELVGGITQGFRTGFEELALNEDKTGLSILAIWLLVFLGFGISMKVVKWVVGKFTRTVDAEHLYGTRYGSNAA